MPDASNVPPDFVLRSRYRPQADQAAQAAAIRHLTVLGAKMNYPRYDDFIHDLQNPTRVTRFGAMELKGQLLRQLLVCIRGVYFVTFKLKMTGTNKPDMVKVIVFLAKFLTNPTSVEKLPHYNLTDGTLCASNGDYLIPNAFNGANYINKYISNGDTRVTPAQPPHDPAWIPSTAPAYRNRTAGQLDRIRADRPAPALAPRPTGRTFLQDMEMLAQSFGLPIFDPGSINQLNRQLHQNPIRERSTRDVIADPGFTRCRPVMMMGTKLLTAAPFNMPEFAHNNRQGKLELKLTPEIMREVHVSEYMKRHPNPPEQQPKTARQSTDSDSDSDLSDEEEEPWAGPTGKSVIVRLFHPDDKYFNPLLFTSDAVILSFTQRDGNVWQIGVPVAPDLAHRNGGAPFVNLSSAIYEAIEVLERDDIPESDRPPLMLTIKPGRSHNCRNAQNMHVVVEYGEMGSPKDVAKWIERNIPTVDADPSKLDNEDDDELEEVVTRFSLTDPLTFCRMTLPARGEHCVHTQCFDLQTFIQFGFQSKKWECPICSKPLTIQGCRVDSFVRTLLSTSGEDDEAIDVETHTGRILREGNSDEEMGYENSLVTPRPEQPVGNVSDDDIEIIDLSDTEIETTARPNAQVSRPTPGSLGSAECPIEL
ncbi:MIZ/SP-RING zinc finger [Carpediemonas membranifera]|uniref:MIZ/SP-RING zinc finger n=1 Tax=Carpediemonas membranifera TaxID=201153 RepID=A0A8J6B8K1_9EUKA|nr:MIZ/SP-RING zinc finger [Carpediemonas membranifera]|eukprot:KAG9395414.1 MIZ/SP-RING zinc finger [Carpediemonas membranifera]